MTVQVYEGDGVEPPGAPVRFEFWPDKLLVREDELSVDVRTTYNMEFILKKMSAEDRQTYFIEIGKLIAYQHKMPRQEVVITIHESSRDRHIYTGYVLDIHERHNTHSSDVELTVAISP